MLLPLAGNQVSLHTFIVTVWPLQESGNITHTYCTILKSLVSGDKVPCKTLSPLTERTPVTVIRSQKTNIIYSSWRVVDGINANDEDI